MVIENSLDEARGKPDHTEKVMRLAQKYIPSAVMHRSLKNMGIARIYQEAEKLCCSSSQAPYALFFEEDLVLGPSYMEALELLMKWASDRDDIAIVTAHGHTHEHLNLAEYRRLLELPPGLYYVHSLWAYAVKTRHLKERRPFIDNYIKLINCSSYYSRDQKSIREYFCDHGLRFIHGTSQDYAKHAALWAFGKCAVTISILLSKYIGREGEHMDEAAFEWLGYNKSDIATFDARLYKRLLPDCVDYTSLKALRLLELQTIESTFAGPLEGPEKEQSNARVVELQTALAEERSRRTVLDSTIAELTQALADERFHREATEAANQSLRSSTSWRLTAPLRRVCDAARRLRPIRERR